MSVYIVTFHGDLDMDSWACHTLDEALENLAGEFNGNEPDPEDDRILVWEVDPPMMRVVWHFSGWHWSYWCDDQVGGPLDQGKLPGHDQSLYNEAMGEDY